MSDLHNAIMNLPCRESGFACASDASFYAAGHRDARHAAAELAAAALAAKDAELERLRDENTKLKVLGPDTEARITVEARGIASQMMQPAIESWRKANAGLKAEVERLTKENERAQQLLSSAIAAARIDVQRIEDLEDENERMREAMKEARRIVSDAMPSTFGIHDSNTRDVYVRGYIDGKFFALEVVDAAIAPPSVTSDKSKCLRLLMATAKSWPRTCEVCGLAGPCRFAFAVTSEAKEKDHDV